ncbi:MAG: hypothetical protein ACI35R_04795 [Bacillus sp. (in: firmicutes)]
MRDGDGRSDNARRVGPCPVDGASFDYPAFKKSIAPRFRHIEAAGMIGAIIRLFRN